MSGLPTRYLKIRYEAVIELDDEVEGISEDSPLKEANLILDQGLKAAFRKNAEAHPRYRGLATRGIYHVGLHHVGPKKKR